MKIKKSLKTSSDDYKDYGGVVVESSMFSLTTELITTLYPVAFNTIYTKRSRETVRPENRRRRPADGQAEYFVPLYIIALHRHLHRPLANINYSIR